MVKIIISRPLERVIERIKPSNKEQETLQGEHQVMLKITKSICSKVRLTGHMYASPSKLCSSKIYILKGREEQFFSCVKLNSEVSDIQLQSPLPRIKANLATKWMNQEFLSQNSH